MRITPPFALAAAVLLPAMAFAGHEFPVPGGVAMPVTPAGSLTLWPYTASDFTDPYAPDPSDPVNLIFLDTDPRAVREALLGLDGTRGAYPPVAPFTCRWGDGMGYEQAAYGEPEGWVGGAIQLACYTPAGLPLGDPFRYHVRLFRIGRHTLGAAHFEYLIKDTPEHEVLSWGAARDFVVYDLMRAGARLAGPPVTLFSPIDHSFRAVRRPVYEGLLMGGAAPILAYAGLPVPPAVPAPGNVPLPADGQALVVAPGLVQHPTRSDVTTTIPAVPYEITVPKPFCNLNDSEYVHISGALEFRMRVRTNPSGQFLRTYELGGRLAVTALTGPDAGRTFDAVVAERHRAMLTDNYEEVTELASQTLLRDPPQLLGWVFAAGQQDGYFRQTVCGFD